MTTAPVPTITDDHLYELEAFANGAEKEEVTLMRYELQGLIQRILSDSEKIELLEHEVALLNSRIERNSSKVIASNAVLRYLDKD